MADTQILVDGLCFGEGPRWHNGRLYFSVGDRGVNLTTKEGAHLYLPHTGAVFRCEPDGSDLEGRGRLFPLPEQLPEKPGDGVVETVHHPFLEGDDSVVGDANVLGADLSAAPGDVAHSRTEILFILRGIFFDFHCILATGHCKCYMLMSTPSQILQVILKIAH